MCTGGDREEPTQHNGGEGESGGRVAEGRETPGGQEGGRRSWGWDQSSHSGLQRREQLHCLSVAASQRLVTALNGEW